MKHLKTKPTMITQSNLGSQLDHGYSEPFFKLIWKVKHVTKLQTREKKTRQSQPRISTIYNVIGWQKNSQKDKRFQFSQRGWNGP